LKVVSADIADSYNEKSLPKKLPKVFGKPWELGKVIKGI
jgi:hypothetical protein